MPQKTIIIAEISEKNGWFNLKSNEGQEISVMVAKCPKIAELLKTAKAGSEVTGNLVEKDGKAYLWELDEKKSGGFGAKPFTSADKSFDAAKISAQAASTLMSLQKDASIEKWAETAEKIHIWILSKQSKPTT